MEVYLCFVLENQRTFPNSPRSVVVRPVARTEPASIIARIVERDAAQMSAYAKQNQPFRLVRDSPLVIGLRISQLC